MPIQAELVATGSILQEKSWALQQSKNFRYVRVPVFVSVFVDCLIIDKSFARNRILQQLSTTDNTITNTRPEVPKRALFSKTKIMAHCQESTNPLDGCTHVFIDLSSNNRPQIRKLIEPQLFPGDPILPVYLR